MTYVLVGAIGFLLGLAAHDLGSQSLYSATSLRPLTGTCPSCSVDRSWTRLVCLTCGRRVSREPVLAVVTTLTALGFAGTTGLTWDLVAYLGFLLLSSALVVTDLEAFRITDRLNLRGSLAIALVLLAAAMLEGSLAAFFRGLGGAGAYFLGASLLFLLVRGQGFGAGDVKLAPQLGLYTAYLGWSVLGWAVFATALIGGVVALVLVLTGHAGKKTELPYGPPMVFGAWVAIVMVGVGAIPVPS